MKYTKDNIEGVIIKLSYEYIISINGNYINLTGVKNKTEKYPNYRTIKEALKCLNSGEWLVTGKHDILSKIEIY